MTTWLLSIFILPGLNFHTNSFPTLGQFLAFQGAQERGNTLHLEGPCGLSHFFGLFLLHLNTDVFN